MWLCLVEDSALFLRHFLEKLTRERQEVMLQAVRRLLRLVPLLPAQAAFSMCNYLIGYVMFYMRTPQDNAPRLITDSMSLLWMVG